MAVGEEEQPEEEEFNSDKIPPKILITNTKIASTDPPCQIALFHPEASFALRRTLIDQARKTFKELEKVELPSLLNHSHRISKTLEEKFEEKFIKFHGYGRGCQYTDPVSRITFKTFLQD